jgi:hypothetical protein
MITQEFKKKVIDALSVSRNNFNGSDARFATAMGINPSIYNRLKKGETDQILSDAKFISLARHLNVSMLNRPEWKIANTPVFQFITTQLQVCQAQGLSSMLVDLSDIGKSFSAQYYCRNNKNAVYIDCSQVKSKQKMIRGIAQGFGVGSTGRYADVYGDLVFYLKTLENPLIVLDEAGDLEHTAMLEIKALWNATEHFCGFYMMGADGLENRIRNSINYKKVGYTELFSRFGKRYGKVIPSAGDESSKLLNATAMMIIKANAPVDANQQLILRNTMGDDGRPSLRRIYNELTKNQ